MTEIQRRILRTGLWVSIVLTLLVIGSILGVFVAVAWNRCTYALRASTDFALRSPRQFYIRPKGSDSNPGTSPELAWRTIEKVNSHSFIPGDSILFEADQQFIGNLVLSADDHAAIQVETASIEGTVRPIVEGASSG